MISLIFIYINQLINILIIHTELKRDYRIEIYGWSLFCARGKIKSQRAEVTEIKDTDENNQPKKRKGTEVQYEEVRRNRGSLVENQNE
jgi:hypothetical protein